MSGTGPGFVEVIATGPGYTEVEIIYTVAITSAAAYEANAAAVTAHHDTTSLGDYDGPSTHTSGPTTTAPTYNTFFGSAVASSSSTLLAPSETTRPYSDNTAYNTGDVGSPSASAAGAQSSSSVEPANTGPSTTAIKAAISTITALALIMTLAFCIRRRRIQKRLRSTGEMSVLPTSTSATLATREQANLEIVAIPPPPPVRYSQLPRRGGTRTWSASSSWADDSEMDALATDGSSLARTISTCSTVTRGSEGTVTLENPFDHPAYTLASRRVRLGPSTGDHDTAVPSSTTVLDPFADSPVSPATDPFLSSPVEAVLTHSGVFDALPVHPAEEASTTFIHHIDGGRAPSQRAGGAPEPDRVGEGEVHIPPTYMELYPSNR